MWLRVPGARRDGRSARSFGHSVFDPPLELEDS